MLDLAFQPDRGAPDPVYRQLEAHLRGLIRTGRLLPGQKLPATRELATALGLGRNTVSQAYEGLAESGCVQARVGQGTFVVRARDRAVGETPAAGRGFVWESLFARGGPAAALPPERLRARPERVHFDLRPGRVDALLLPVDALRRAFARATRSLPRLANALDPAGFEPLRREIARALLARGIVCEASDVLVVAGAQQALDLVGRTLLDPGDAVAMEEPGYFGAALAFRACGARLVPVAVDAEGLRTGELARVLRARRVKLVYATPAVQCPTGVALAERRRAALLDLADAHQTPVVEDDYDCQLRLGTRAAPALKTVDPAGQVIHVGTFSKALFPGLRLGYVVAAPALLARLRAALVVTSFGSSPLAQAWLAELMRGGALEKHVRRMRRLYAERLDALASGLEAGLGGVAVPRPAGGTALWLTLPPQADAGTVHARAGEAGIVCGRGEDFFLSGRGEGHLLLSFATHESGTLHEAGTRLGRIVAEAVQRGGRSGPAPTRRGEPRRAGGARAGSAGRAG